MAEEAQDLVDSREPIKILTLPNPLNGCTWYRIKQPMNYFATHELAMTGAIFNDDLSYFLNNAPEVIKMADVIIWRNGHQAQIQSILRDYDCANKVILYDTDDNDFKSPWCQEMYRYYGTEDVWYHDPKTGEDVPVWIDKDSEFGKTCPEKITYDKAENLRKEKKLIDMVQMSDAVCVTQTKLGEVYRKHNPNIWVVPNAIDFSKFQRIKQVRDKQSFRLGWAGGCSHYDDFHAVAPVVKDFLKAHPDVVLVMAGDPPMELFKDIPENQLECHRWVHPEAHPYRLSLLDLDCAFIPLLPNEFSECKSPVKYEEFSAVGVPSVVMRTTPYKEVITDMVNGMFFSNPTEFRRCLEKMYADPLLRFSIREEAYKNVHRNFSTDKVCMDFFNKIMKEYNKKNGLTNNKE